MNELAVFDAAREEIAKYKAINATTTFNYQDPEGNKLARSYVFKLRKAKTPLAKFHKDAKHDALRLCQEIDAEHRFLRNELDEMIAPHAIEIKKIEDEAEAIREAEKLAAAAEVNRQEQEKADALRKREEAVAAAEAKQAAEEERIIRERELLEAEKKAEEVTRARVEQTRLRAEEDKRMALEQAERASKDALDRAKVEQQEAVEAERAKAEQVAKEKQDALDAEVARKTAHELVAKQIAEREAKAEAARVADQRHRDEVVVKIHHQLHDHIDATSDGGEIALAITEAIRDGEIDNVVIQY